MNDSPWLLSRAARSSPERFGERSLPRLGKLASVLSEALNELPDVCSAWAQLPIASDWGAVFSRECLLTAATDPRTARVATAIARKSGLDLTPFPDGPSVEAFLDAPPTAVLIPLERGSFAQFGQIWIFATAAWPDGDGRKTFQDFHRDFLPENLGMFLLGAERESQAITGFSWELGVNLAVRAFSQRNTALPIARDWIITGGVAPDDRTEAVGFSAKKDLARTAQGRKWLLPAANQSSVPPEWEAAAHGQVYFANDLESAWSQVTGAGFVDGGILEWDSPPLSQPREFHCYVSPALNPTLAAIIWSQPKKIVLWVSRPMKAYGAALKEALCVLRQSHLPNLASEESIVIQEVNDSDLQGIRSQLLSCAALGDGGPDPVIFSITGGNLLMRVALLDLARLRPHLHLVYRQESREGLTFVHLSHPNLRPVAGKIEYSSLQDEAANAWRKELLNLDSRDIPLETMGEKLAEIVSGLPWPTRLKSQITEAEAPDIVEGKLFSEKPELPALKEEAS